MSFLQNINFFKNSSLQILYFIQYLSKEIILFRIYFQSKYVFFLISKIQDTTMENESHQAETKRE